MRRAPAWSTPLPHPGPYGGTYSSELARPTCPALCPRDAVVLKRCERDAELDKAREKRETQYRETYHLGFEVCVEEIHSARTFGHDAPTTALLLHDILLAAALLSKLDVPFTVVGVRLKKAMKAVAITRRVDRIGTV